MKTTIAIHESKTSTKILKFITSYYELIEFASPKQAKKILKADETGNSHGCYFTKSGKMRAIYYK